VYNARLIPPFSLNPSSGFVVNWGTTDEAKAFLLRMFVLIELTEIPKFDIRSAPVALPSGIAEFEERFLDIDTSHR
jgi:hypothetical protein